MSAAIQLDMFAPRAPALLVARVHPHNPRALDVSDCHRERHDCGGGIVINVIVARCADGLEDEAGAFDDCHTKDQP